MCTQFTFTSFFGTMYYADKTIRQLVSNDYTVEIKDVVDVGDDIYKWTLCYWKE